MRVIAMRNLYVMQFIPKGHCAGMFEFVELDDGCVHIPAVCL